MVEVIGIDHVYFNQHFGFVLRPSRVSAKANPYAPGLHHFCLRVDSAADVHAVANQLRALGVDVTEPRLYPEYASDCVATFFESPDGIRLEVTNYRQERKERHDHWYRGVLTTFAADAIRRRGVSWSDWQDLRLWWILREEQRESVQGQLRRARVAADPPRRSPESLLRRVAADSTR